MTAVPPGVVRHLQIISDKHVDQLQAYKTIEQIVIPLHTLHKAPAFQENITLYSQQNGRFSVLFYLRKVTF